MNNNSNNNTIKGVLEPMYKFYLELNSRIKLELFDAGYRGYFIAPLLKPATTTANLISNICDLAEENSQLNETWIRFYMNQ